MKSANGRRKTPALCDRNRGEGRPSNSVSSYTRPRAFFVPPAAQGLVEIPWTQIGLLDTVKLMLRTTGVHKKDLGALRASPEWTERRSAGSEKHVLGHTIRKYGESIVFHREHDGCRLRIRQNKIEVEVSVPRVLGFANDEQDRLSEEDDLAAVMTVTSRLLPLTTLRAKISSPRSFWFITRLDIAVNFAGDVREFVEAYRHARRPRSSTKPEVYNDSGLAFYGTDYALLIYDPGRRLPRGKMRSMLLGRRFGMSDDPRVRVEFRFQTQRAIQQLLNNFGRDIRGLPFYVHHPGKTARVLRYHLDHHRLHQILATELRALQGRATIQTSGGPKMTLKTRYFLCHLSEHPELWREVEPAYATDTVRKFRSQQHAVMASERQLDIVELAWNRPRPHPRLQEKLARRSKSIRAMVQECGQ